MREQLAKFLDELKEILASLLNFLSPQQKRWLFIGLPVFGSIAYAGFTLFDRMNYGPLYSWWDLPANRHDQAANLPFADGHVWNGPAITGLARKD